jgi:hypothetical protein
MAAGGENTAQQTRLKLHEAVFVNGFVFKGIARFRFPNHPKQARRRMRCPMATMIMSGFPLYRCSWSYKPIVPIARTRSMIRWLDWVCLKQTTFKSRFDDATRKKRSLRVANGA